MTASSTHSTRLARLASKDGILSYAQALELVRRARAEKLLPEILDDDGMRAALEVLRHMAPARRAISRPLASHLLLGRDHTAEAFVLSPSELSTHAMILGATGSGKSVTTRTFVAGMLDLGWSGVVLDLEDDAGAGGLREFCVNYTKANSLAYQQLSLDSSATTWLNPLEGLGPDEALDLLLSFYEVDDHYWTTLNKKVLGQVVNLCYDAHAADPVAIPYPSMFAIGSLLEQGNLTAATKKLRAVVAASSPPDPDRYSALVNPASDTQKTAAGLGAKLTQIYDTAAGKHVLTGTPSASLDLNATGLAYIGIDDTGRHDLARLVSSATLVRTSALAHRRLLTSGPKPPRFLAITSAAQTHYPHLVALLSKARAGGICLVLADQSPTNWPVGTFDQVSQNINISVVMAQTSASAAELCANLIGEPTVTLTELRQLGVGEAVVRVDRPETRVRWVSVTPYSRPSSPPVRATTHGKVILVASPIGGSGRTTLSYLLATQLATLVKPQGKRVCLLDADLNLPDINKIIDYYSPNITHVLNPLGSFNHGNSQDQISPARLAEAILHRPDLGIDLLLGPAIPSEISGALLDPKFYSQVLSKLRLDYDYVIVDTPVAPTHSALMREALLAQADYTVVTTHLAMRSLLGVDSWLQDIGVSKVARTNASRFGLVINRVDDPSTRPAGGHSMTVQEATRELSRIPLAGVVPTSAIWATLPDQGRIVDVVGSLEPDVTAALNAILDSAIKGGRRA